MLGRAEREALRYSHWTAVGTKRQPPQHSASSQDPHWSVKVCLSASDDWKGWRDGVLWGRDHGTEMSERKITWVVSNSVGDELT